MKDLRRFVLITQWGSEKIYGMPKLLKAVRLRTHRSIPCSFKVLHRGNLVFEVRYVGGDDNWNPFRLMVNTRLDHQLWKEIITAIKEGALCLPQYD